MDRTNNYRFFHLIHTLNFRSSLLSYIGKYELNEKLGDILDFFVAQLKYDQDSGRIAAGLTLSLIFKSQGNFGFIGSVQNLR